MGVYEDTKDRGNGASQDAEGRGRRRRRRSDGGRCGMRPRPRHGATRATRSRRLIAFGAGCWRPSLLQDDGRGAAARPRGERPAGRLVEPLKETGKQLASDLGDSVKEAASEVKDTATEAATTTAQRAKEKATT